VKVAVTRHCALKQRPKPIENISVRSCPTENG
jgi:hypothetical protein